jgi:hypothetical protein
MAADVRGKRVGGQIIGRDEAHVVRLVAGRALAAGDGAHEAADDRVRARHPALPARQSLHDDREASLLACVADDPRPRRRAGFHTAARLTLPGAVGTVHEQHTTGVVEHSGNDADGEAHRVDLSLSESTSANG